jgi:hypothetical protein
MIVNLVVTVGFGDTNRLANWCWHPLSTTILDHPFVASKFHGSDLYMVVRF